MQQHEVPIQPESARVSQMETTTRDDEISLLDLLVIMAENWLWLVVVPLVLGSATFIFLSLQPSDYRLSASVPVPAAEVAAFLEGPEGQAVVPGAEGELTVSATEPGDASELSMVSPEPEAARERLEAVTGAIQRALEAGEIAHPEAGYIERIADLEAMIALRASLIERLDEGLSNGAEGDEQTLALTALALAQLLDGRAADLDRLDEFRATVIEPMTEIEKSDISAERLGRSPLIVAVLVVLGSGFLMLIVVFARHGLRSVAATAEGAEKIGRIKRAFFIGR